MQLDNQPESKNVVSRAANAKYGISWAMLALILVSIAGVVFGFTRVRTAPPDKPAISVTDTAETKDQKQFVSKVLASTEEVWGQLEPGYEPPKLVFFVGQVEGACGIDQASKGPFYCRGDRTIYLDVDFFVTLDRLGGSGDFARAYVIAHEVGHHIQLLKGVPNDESAGPLSTSVRRELQADFYAGVWGHYAQKKGLLSPGDLEEALRAAAAVGNDRSGKSPDTFTHGTSEQRARWFRKGFETGDPKLGDTFGAETL